MSRVSTPARRRAAAAPREGAATPSPLARYATAALLVALAAAATLVAEPVLAPQYSILFYAAVLCSAWYGGLGPGLLSTALAVASLDFFFVPPRYVFGHYFAVRDVVGLAVFAGVAVVTSSLSGRLRAQRERAEAHAREVERLAAELEARAALRLEEKVSEAEALAAELARTNRSLARKSEEAEAATRAKSAFLAAVSHELRTPLVAIAGYAELMAAGLRGPLTPEQRTAVERIQASQRHLLGLINNLLDSARIEAGQLSVDVADVDAATVVAHACAIVEPTAAAKGLRLELAPMSDLPPVRADGERLLQILVNLLSNATKFTDRGTVRVAARVVGDGVALSVSDSGRGVPEGERERIFEAFAQVRPSDGRAHAGTGLGLSISRDLARAMGGDIAVESRVGEGSTFTLWLERADLAGVEAAAPASSRAGTALVRARRPLPAAAIDVTGPIAATAVVTLWPPSLFVPPG